MYRSYKDKGYSESMSILQEYPLKMYPPGIVLDSTVAVVPNLRSASGWDYPSVHGVRRRLPAAPGRYVGGV